MTRPPCARNGRAATGPCPPELRSATRCLMRIGRFDRQLRRAFHAPRLIISKELIMTRKGVIAASLVAAGFVAGAGTTALRPDWISIDVARPAQAAGTAPAPVRSGASPTLL